MKIDKNFIGNLLGKWGSGLTARISKASLSSRITGGACILAMLVWLLSPSYGKILPTIIVGITALAWLVSVLFHSLKRASMNGVPTHNPFTLPLFAVIALFILGLTYSRTSLGQPLYDSDDEPINQLFDQIEMIASQSGENMETHLSRLNTRIFKGGNADYNLLLIGEDGEILYTQTNWYSGGAQKLYPLVSRGKTNADGQLLVLVNEREQVVGTFMIYGSTSSVSTQMLPASSLTLPAQGESEISAQQPAAEQSTFDKLYARYFPSFGSVIDAYTMQLRATDWMVVTDTSTPYKGELANREYERDSISFLEWKGEPVEEIRMFYGSYEEERLLINALNSLSEEKRIALVEHTHWLDQAYRSAVSDDDSQLRAQVFSNDAGTQSVVLLYESTPGIYPLLQARQNQWYFCDQVFVAAMLMIPVYWILLAFWVFTDAKRRGHKSPALWGLLTMIGNVVALIVYNLVRPQMRIDKSGKRQPKGVCPLCGATLKDDYIACPGCGILLRSKCRNCARALENDWNFCPYCTQQIIRELPEGSGDEQQENPVNEPLDSVEEE